MYASEFELTTPPYAKGKNGHFDPIMGIKKFAPDPISPTGP